MSADTPSITSVHESIAELASVAGEAESLRFTPPAVGLDSHRYDVEDVNTLRNYPDDARIQAAVRSPQPHADIALLALSPHWEDRVRAITVRAAVRDDITLPDGFPCIYEPADSPKNARLLHPRPQAWVTSPDEAMLRELLPLYRELWHAYESQWPNSPQRTFEVGHLDGLSPRGVYRPGTTPRDVIGRTMLTHDRMYSRAPQHLREMHPLHEQWERAKGGSEPR